VLTHLRTRRRLGAWLDGALDEGEARTTLTHMEGCARCRREADELRRLRDFVRGVVSPPPAPDWTGFWAGVVRKIEEGRGRRPARPAAGWGAWLLWPRVAFPGALAVALLVSLTLWQTFYWPIVPEAAVIVRSAGTELPGGTVMVYAPPERDLAVVWLFEGE
jgi:anti-sigma factor RsiW